MRAVIMGGTSGIGLATAERLMADGVEVTVTGRDPVKLADVKDRVTAAEQVDGTNADEVTAFLERMGEFEHLVLAFSGGSVGFGPLRDMPLDRIREAFERKLFGYLFAIQHAKVTETITMVSAASARAAMPGTIAGATVNGAIERMVPPLAVELAPVRVNAVSAGLIDTPWWSFLDDEQRAAQYASFAENLPTKRVGQAHEVADAIRFLTTATYVTGQILPVDGGATVG